MFILVSALCSWEVEAQRVSRIRRRGTAIRHCSQPLLRPPDKSLHSSERRACTTTVLVRADRMGSPYRSSTGQRLRGHGREAPRRRSGPAALVSSRARQQGGVPQHLGEREGVTAAWRGNGGHPKPPLRALIAYCHFAVIHHRNPVGLAVMECRSRGSCWPGTRSSRR